MSIVTLFGDFVDRFGDNALKRTQPIASFDLNEKKLLLKYLSGKLVSFKVIVILNYVLIVAAH